MGKIMVKFVLINVLCYSISCQIFNGLPAETRCLIIVEGFIVNLHNKIFPYFGQLSR